MRITPTNLVSVKDRVRSNARGAIKRAAFRESPATFEAIAMDRRFAGSSGPGPGAFGWFDIPSALCHDPDEVVDGVGVLCISGPLEHHDSGWWQSYEGLISAIDCALQDPNVQALVLKLDSPGGVAAGMGEAHKAIRRARKTYGKPIYAYADEMACSAAYHLASACDEVWLPEAGQVGSVGVILCTIDESEALKRAGVAVRYVVTGERKADLHPGQPVDDAVLEVAQQKVDFLGGLFFRAVARARGMSPEAVQGLQAGVFHGFDAVQAGLADGVAGWPKFLAIVRAAIGATISSNRATPSTGVPRTSGPKAKPMAKILKLIRAATAAKAEKTAASASLAAASSPKEKAVALKRVELALRGKIEADASLAEAKGKMTKEKYEKIVEEEEEEEERKGSAGEEEEEEEENAEEEKDEEEEEESDAEEAEEDSDSDADSDADSTGSKSESEEEEEEEEKALAKAFRAKASGPGLHTPYRLLRAVKQATGQKSIKGAFGALAAMGPKLAAVSKLEARLATLEASSRKIRVDALIDGAKAAGRIVGKAHAETLRADGAKQGTKWLKAHLAALPKLHRTTASGDAFVPRADADGNPIGGMSADQQKILADATAGMSPDEARKFQATVLARSQANGKSPTPRS